MRGCARCRRNSWHATRRRECRGCAMVVEMAPEIADSGASVAVADAGFCSRFDAEACKDTALRTLIVVNGAVGVHAAPNAIAADPWLDGFASELAEADTHRNEMAFWMYSSGSTGRP